MSNAFESLSAKICVTAIVIATKITSASRENKPVADEIIKNHKENPAVTAKDLNLTDDSSILNWINECYKTALCECRYSN